jgi:dTDP-4-dehydrorhamnose 3,5-epimerase-like enzyme
VHRGEDVVDTAADLCMAFRRLGGLHIHLRQQQRKLFIDLHGDLNTRLVEMRQSKIPKGETDLS